MVMETPTSSMGHGTFGPDHPLLRAALRQRPQRQAVLMQMAAERLQVPPATAVKDGVIFQKKQGKRVSYAN